MIAALLLASSLQTVAVRVDLAHAVNHLVPMRSIGAGLDSENPGSISQIYGKADVGQMLASGLGPITYRSYTELSIQAWHWNPSGTWSDAAHGDGYWTSTATPGTAIENSYGYRLPERGNTHDQGNNDDYSRLDDGNAATYWKSNPYLTQAWTGESDSLHPQWVLIDLRKRQPVDAIRITWSNPYAVDYDVQYWTGSDAIYGVTYGRWANFPGGIVTKGKGGVVTLRLAKRPANVRFVRVWMTASSHTCDSHGSGDPRNCVGYAIGEVGIGTLNGSGGFSDLVRHVRDSTQTPTIASSVDPWHEPADRTVYQVQPGLDAVFQSGVTRSLPALVPVSLLYGTPDDAVNEIRYLESRGDKLRGVEMGEEPDGQFILPEDYAALYVEWAKRLHAVDPSLQLGGPVFQGASSDVQTWPNASGDVSWLHRFLLYLNAHGMMSSLSFMSFEHYPFAACTASPYQDLQREPKLASSILNVWRNDGVPANVPFYITEMNFSANAGSLFQDVPGALWFADTVGSFLSDGASAAYLYQYAPEPMQRTSAACDAWGSYGMFSATYRYVVRQRTAQFFAANLLTSQWAENVDAYHTMYRTLRFAMGNIAEQVTAYSIARPDGQTAVMLINKNPTTAYNVSLSFVNGSASYPFVGTMTIATFGRAQYVWHGTGRYAYANPDGPIAITTGPASATVTLEPGSITVVRGTLSHSRLAP